MSPNISCNLELERTKRRYTSTLNYLRYIQKSGKIKLLSRSQVNALKSRLSRHLNLIKRHLKLAVIALGLGVITPVDLDAQCQMNRLPISTQTSFSTFNEYSAPTFVDIDEDGDMDLIIGFRRGTISTYENKDGHFERLNGLINPLSGEDPAYFLSPTFADIDNDGDDDAFIGRGSGIAYFENEDGVFTEVTGAANPLDGINVNKNLSPTFIDIEGDGDLDVFIGEYYGTIRFFRNENGAFTNVTGASNPFNGEDFGSYSSPSPTFVDIDNDGDPDAFVGALGGDISFFRNDSGIFSEVTGTGNPLNGVDVGSNAKPTFVDIDNDGDSDVFIGDLQGFIRFFKNENGVLTEELLSDNSFEAMDLGSSSAPTFGEIDNDGDEDLVIGNQDGELRYFINTNDTFNEAIGINNPFDNIDVGSFAKPVLIDFDPTDSDHDLDLFIGASDGTIHFYKNTGGSFSEITGTGNPLNGIDVGSLAAPAFIDFNKDNAPDAFIGAGDGTIHYYKNNNDGTFSEVLLFGNPFTAVDVEQSATLTFYPYDKSRAFVGSNDGTIREYRLGSSYYQLVDDYPFQGIDVGFGSAPAISNDGKVFIGQSRGKIFAFNKEGNRSNVWQGDNSNHWNADTSNWELKLIPRGGCDNVYINGSTILNVDPTHLAAGRTLTVKQEGQFEVKPGAQMIIAQDILTDNSGNIYKTGKIGKATWMLENLRTSEFNDGTLINQIDAGNTWSIFDFPAKAIYDNTENNLIPYGYLYNGYAIEDSRLCPVGWHVSTIQDWEDLISFLGGPAIAAGPLKEAGFTHWSSPNSGATDQVGFGALPGGNRRPDGSFGNLNLYGNYWVIEQPGPSLIDYNIEYNTVDVTQIPITDKKWGLSVRCVEN